MKVSCQTDSQGGSQSYGAVRGVCRRDFLKVAAAGLLVGCRTTQQPSVLETGEPTARGDEPSDGLIETAVANSTLQAHMDDPTMVLVGLCGLYCGNCSDYVNGECHGCGCECGGCAARYHHAECGIYRCAKGRELASCAACDDLACTTLVQFAYDPVWLTHGPVLENLRRIRRIGIEAWVEEQDEYWSDRQHMEKWNYLQKKQAEAYKEFEAHS